LFKELDVQVRNSQSKFEKSLLNKIGRAANRLEQEMESELRVGFALTLSQFRVLDGLADLGEVSQSELAISLGVTPAVVTRQVDVLSGRGLVNQRQNPRSKREKILRLTTKGEAAAGDAAKLVREREASWRSVIKAQDEAVFERVLLELNRVGE